MIIAASDDDVLRCVKEMLKSKFRMKDLGKLTHFLGIDFEVVIVLRCHNANMYRKYWKGFIC